MIIPVRIRLLHSYADYCGHTGKHVSSVSHSGNGGCKGLHCVTGQHKIIFVWAENWFLPIWIYV